MDQKQPSSLLERLDQVKNKLDQSTPQAIEPDDGEPHAPEPPKSDPKQPPVNKTKEAEPKPEPEEEVPAEREETPPTATDFEKEIQTLQKRVKDNQRAASQSLQAIKSLKTVVNQMVEEGDLSDDDAAKLLGAVKINGTTILDLQGSEGTPSGGASALNQILTQEVMEEYLDFTGENIDEFKMKMASFQAYCDELGSEDREGLFESLIDQKKPVKMLKSVLDLGEKNLQGIYGEIMRAGGVKKYIASTKESQKKLEKENERLKKKLAQFEMDQPSQPFSANNHTPNVPSLGAPKNLIERLEKQKQDRLDVFKKF